MCLAAGSVGDGYLQPSGAPKSCRERLEAGEIIDESEPYKGKPRKILPSTPLLVESALTGATVVVFSTTHRVVRGVTKTEPSLGEMHVLLLKGSREDLWLQLQVLLMTHKINCSTYPFTLTAEDFSGRRRRAMHTVSDSHVRIPNPVNQLDCKSKLHHFLMKL